MPDAFAAMQLQVEALFTHDTAGRIVRQNEPEGPPAPLFFLGRTTAANLWRIRHDIPASLAERLNLLAQREPVDPALPKEPHLASKVVDLLQSFASGVVASGGPAFCFPSSIPSLGETVRIDRTTIDMRGRFDWLDAELEYRWPCFAVVRDGAAVAVCFSSRRTARACEAGVETLEEHRGRGYATIVTAAWARAVRAEGRTPLYSTSWDNLASRGVARRLGLIQYGADWSIK